METLPQSEEILLFQRLMCPRFLECNETIWKLKGRLYEIYFPSLIKSIGYPQDKIDKLGQQLRANDFFKSMILDELITVLEEKICRETAKGNYDLSDIRNDLEDAKALKLRESNIKIS